MSENDLRSFFADVRCGLHINLGLFCDRNRIFRPDFSNFMNGKKFYTSLSDLNIMREDIIDHCRKFLDIYEKIA